ncbi:uncharacterized protein LOC130749968 isoform X1 [Actinidia eriantha]|uniref:uncharacterized protein LOC130749968 isoform X1 n=1 Tax=Actinidia eriantha TaxID=165200 RepID=UPI002590B37B|nr:uncharacterized protein LOC130749968 isoform X1 [Actinidia eriantha]
MGLSSAFVEDMEKGLVLPLLRHTNKERSIKAMKRKFGENDNYIEDRISALPDEIISSILSLLTITEAGRTSVLAHRWKNLWKLFTGRCLDFDGSKTMVCYSSHYIPKSFPEFRNLKQLELDVAAVPDQNILFLAPLIDVSPCLYRLVVKVKVWSPSKWRRRQEPLEWECRCPGEPRENINGLLESLKVVEIVGWVGHTTDIQLATYLLEKAVLLETIIIDARSPYAKGRYEFEELAEKGKKDAARERAKQLEAKLPSGTKLVIL